jgi:hypothetical protein
MENGKWMMENGSNNIQSELLSRVIFLRFENSLEFGF